MPSPKPDPSDGANPVSPTVSGQAKTDVQSAKTAAPQSVVQPVQNGVHPRFSHSLWLWLGLSAVIIVVIVAAFLAYTKFKFGRKSPLGKRNDRMTNRITERQKFSTSLQELQQAFNAPKGSSNIPYEYDRLLRILESYWDDLILNNLSQDEKDAFELCIKACKQHCKDAKGLKSGSLRQRQEMIEGLGKEAAKNINELISFLSGTQGTIVPGHKPFQGIGSTGSTQNNSAPDRLSMNDNGAVISSTPVVNSIQVQLNQANANLALKIQLLNEQQAKILDLKNQLSEAGSKASRMYNSLDEVRITLEKEQETSKILRDTAGQLKKELEEQKGMWEKLESLTSPEHARATLPEEAASWSELDNYVQNLLGVAELTNRHDFTAATAKLNDLQRILFSPPPMNSLFDPLHPASVDIFARILYLQADLRAKLLEQGIQVIMPASGEAFDTQRHECAEADLVWDHEDPSRHNTIYAVRTIGFEDGNNGRVLKKAAVKKRMFDGTLPETGLTMSISTEAEPSEMPRQNTVDIKDQKFPVSSAIPEEELQAENSQIKISSPLKSTGEPTQETMPDKIAAPDELKTTTVGASDLKSTEFSESTSTEAETPPVSAVSEETSDALVGGMVLANDNVLSDPAEERRERAKEEAI